MKKIILFFMTAAVAASADGAVFNRADIRHLNAFVKARAAESKKPCFGVVVSFVPGALAFATDRWVTISSSLLVDTVSQEEFEKTVDAAIAKLPGRPNPSQMLVFFDYFKSLIQGISKGTARKILPTAQTITEIQARAVETVKEKTSQDVSFNPHNALHLEAFVQEFSECTGCSVVLSQLVGGLDWGEEHGHDVIIGIPADAADTEILGVLCHELGHVYYQHDATVAARCAMLGFAAIGFLVIAHNYTAPRTITGAGNLGLQALGLGSLISLLGLYWARENELEADTFADSCGQAKGLCSSLGRYIEDEPSNLIARLIRMLLATHPSTRDRIVRLKREE